MIIDVNSIRHLLGIKEDVSLTPEEMSLGLKVTFFPSISASSKVEIFCKRLKCVFDKCGVKILDFNEVCTTNIKGKKRVDSGVVIIFWGNDIDGKMPMDYIGSLSNNPIIRVIENKTAVEDDFPYLERMSVGLELFTTHMCHLVICISNIGWRSYSYNGFSEFLTYKDFSSKVLNSLIPKIATRVMPMRIGDFEITHEENDFINNKKTVSFVRDLVKGGRLLAHSKLFYPVKNVNEFKYKKSFYRRITRQYLDERTGMSYGYIARQLPVLLSKCVSFSKYHKKLQKVIENIYQDDNNKLFLSFYYSDRKWLMEIPDIWVLMSRSGSNKTNLNPNKDVLMIGLSAGKVTMRIPKSINLDLNYRPSFDTRLILAHSLANAIYANFLKYFSKKETKFANMIETMGAGLIHWHGNINSGIIPRGWHVYGHANPPVLCSSPQSSIYAFIGKEATIINSLVKGYEFLGDVHIEPQHGLNIVGPSLKRMSHFLFSTSFLNNHV